MRPSTGHRGRIDGRAKASGATRYVADLALEDVAHVALVRSTEAHARIVGIDTEEARDAPGVIGVFTAADVSATPYGRGLKDSPILARDTVRFIGERVAAVVAGTRRQAERAAALVEVDYDPLPAVLTAAEALAPGAPRVHEDPSAYEGSVALPGDGPNVVYHAEHGSPDDVDAALAAAAYSVDSRYALPSVHQGYLETQACVGHYLSADEVHVWLTNKAPARVRDMIADSLHLEPSAIDLHPLALGGDFGGKGSAQQAPLCVELSRLTGRPVRSVLRYSEDLTAGNPRHRAEVRVRLGCDADGRLLAASITAVLDSGAYGGFTPSGRGPHGIVEVSSYRIPHFHYEVHRVYTNTVPRGNMRAPGAPQGTFAFESTMDELALAAGLPAEELRRRNFLREGESSLGGRVWAEHRGPAVLDAALAAYEPLAPPAGWLHGRGLAAYSRGNPSRVDTSLRITPLAGGGLRVETPLIETGTGSHTVMARLVAEQLGVPDRLVEVVGASTSALPEDQGAGGSRVTSGFATAVDVAAKQWHNRLVDEPVTVLVNQPITPDVGSYVVQIAQVAVDPESGELTVLEVLTAVDVAEIVNPAAFQMQLDGGVAMGFGTACTEDLDEEEGQVWAANLGEFRIPTAADVPRYRTVLVHGGLGVGTANVKSVGESSTPPVAAAIANAVHDATGVRLRTLPLTAERIFAGLEGRR
jgi:putative selenate reductase molybdopterin-binding subunit